MGVFKQVYCVFGCGCSESHIVREMLLQNMNHHKDKGACVRAHVCICISVHVVRASVQLMNEPGG